MKLILNYCQLNWISLHLPYFLVFIAYLLSFFEVVFFWHSISVFRILCHNVCDVFSSIQDEKLSIDGTNGTKVLQKQTQSDFFLWHSIQLYSFLSHFHCFYFHSCALLTIQIGQKENIEVMDRKRNTKI